jgi:hypothetical protein
VARLEVMLAGASEPWIESIRELIRQEIAGSVPYAQTYDYVVTATTGSTIDALPSDPTRGAPPLTGVPFRCGVPGGSATLTPGTHVGITFLDGNPGKPVLSGAIDSTGAVMVAINAATVSLAGGGHPIALGDVLDGFIKVFETWVPVPTDGGAALKTLISAWALSAPPYLVPFVTSGSLKSSTG